MRSDIDWEIIEQKIDYNGNPIRVSDIMHTACNLCCCGTEEVGDLLYEVLHFCSIDDHEEKNKINSKGCYKDVSWQLAGKVLNSLGYVEHGTGIGWPWLTEDGERLLKFIESLPKQEDVLG